MNNSARSGIKKQALAARGEDPRAWGIVHIIRIPNENPMNSSKFLLQRRTMRVLVAFLMV